MDNLSDDELLEALGVETKAVKASLHTPREERIIAGFEEIQKFVEEHGRAPSHREDGDIFERLYAVRLDRMRELSECRAVLAKIDKHGLLETAADVTKHVEELDDDDLLAELGVENEVADDITVLTHVKSRAEVRAAEEVADRKVCADFKTFKPLFKQVQSDLDAGIRQARKFEGEASIKKGEFFIVGGIMAYVAEVGETIKAPNGEPDARLRVIYSNGTESNLLRRSLQRALYQKEDNGRRITDPAVGPLFDDVADTDDMESGTIYVLSSKSDHPYVAANRQLIHKIGVTGGKVESRIANAKLDATYLLADVEIVATYKLFNINRTRLERLIHRIFERAQLDLQINDRFGNPVKPREWFLVPLEIIDKAVAKIVDGSIVGVEYDPEASTFFAK